MVQHGIKSRQDAPRAVMSTTIGSQLPKIRQLTAGSQLPIMINYEPKRKGRPGLKALRENVNLTQAQLALAVDSSEKAVRNWENDGAIPSLDKAVLLAKVLRVSLKRLANEFDLDTQGVPDDSTQAE